MSNRASRGLTKGNLLGEPLTYNAILKQSNVPLITLNYYNCRRPSREAKAKDLHSSKRLISPGAISDLKCLKHHFAAKSFFAPLTTSRALAPQQPLLQSV